MRSSELRRHARFVTQWHLLYANEELIGQGTLVNLSQFGGQVVGTMPVEIGMVFTLWLSPAHREEALYVQEAPVVWARAHEFGLAFRNVNPKDLRWLTSFLEIAERRHSFHRILHPPGTEELAALPLALPVRD